MANKKDGNQKTQTKTITKKTTTNSNKKSTNKPAVKSTKSTAKKSSLAKKTTTVTKKAPVKNIDKDLEKTIIIEDIERKINNIVKNKKIKINEQNIEDIKFENIARVENAKYKQSKKNKHLLAIGVIISILGIIALIVTLIANRIVDKEFISDQAIALMVVASILIEIFGAFIIINES